MKWDGYRTLALKDGSRVKLLSRNLKDATKLYPSIVREVARLGTESALLDGEVVAVDEEGRPSFQALHHQAAHTVVYYAFDLLHLDGRDLTTTPLDERRELLAGVMDGSRLLRSEPLPGTPEQIEQAVRELHLEGVVAKRNASRYEPGKRSRSWVKVKFNRRQEFVVGGYKPLAGGFESLLVGYYEGRKLLFASKVRAGLTPHTRAELFPVLKSLAQPKCSFADLPSSRTGHWGEGITADDMAALRWVKPRIVVEVSFVEWTRDGLLRHPEFVAVRTDKLAPVHKTAAGLHAVDLKWAVMMIIGGPDRPAGATAPVLDSGRDLVDLNGARMCVLAVRTWRSRDTDARSRRGFVQRHNGSPR